MEIEELKELLGKLSEAERKRLLKILQSVTFTFQINKSFLEYSNHPITIPREFYPDMDIHGITETDEATMILPDGSITSAYIHYSTSSYGPYYQIRIRSGYSGGGIAALKIGDRITVEMENQNNKIIIGLNKQ